VRKAAYQSLGAFIATFYIPNGNDTLAELEDEGGVAQDESTMGLLSDSMLQDNSLLDSSATNTTADPSSEHRHPSPNTTPPVDDGAISNSSTPLHNSSSSRVDGLVQEPEFTSFEFWRSPIPNVVDGEGAGEGRSKVERRVDGEGKARGEGGE
jgi:hypothetical protein